MKATWRAGDRLGGRVQHAYCSRRTHEAARICLLGAGLLLASLALRPRSSSGIFTGVDASNNATSGYLGAGCAFGKGLYDPGWHVRAVGSLGRYDYRGTLFGTGSDLAKTFDGEAGYTAALLGHQFRAQSLFLKLFAGIEGEDQRISPHDPQNSVQGSAVGLKLCGRNLARLLTALVPVARRLLWHGVSAILESCRLSVWPALTLGLEGGALGNQEYEAGRGGGLLRLDLRAVELTQSGGFTGNYLEDDPSGYASLGLYRAF
jgi:hypothetical protein